MAASGPDFGLRRLPRREISAASAKRLPDRVTCGGPAILHVTARSRSYPADGRISGHPRWGDDANPDSGHVSERTDRQDARRNVTQPRTYEATFAGQAGRVLRAEFDDCEIVVGSGTTTLRVELPDQAAPVGLIHRITGLGLEVLDVHRVAPPLSGTRCGTRGWWQCSRPARSAPRRARQLRPGTRRHADRRRRRSAATRARA
jgi:hypothetical protein